MAGKLLLLLFFFFFFFGGGGGGGGYGSIFYPSCTAGGGRVGWGGEQFNEVQEGIDGESSWILQQ